MHFEHTFMPLQWARSVAEILRQVLPEEDEVEVLVEVDEDEDVVDLPDVVDELLVEDSVEAVASFMACR